MKNLLFLKPPRELSSANGLLANSYFFSGNLGLAMLVSLFHQLESLLLPWTDLSRALSNLPLRPEIVLQDARRRILISNLPWKCVSRFEEEPLS